MTTLRLMTQRLTLMLPPISMPALTLMMMWVFTMIGLPIARWLGGDAVLPAGILVAALLQASAVFLALAQAWSLSQATRAFVIVAVIGWAAEFIGHQTAFPFGAYTYTEALQPQLGDVPLLIPVAWFMLMPSAWAIAGAIIGPMTNLGQRIAFIILSAVALTAWDLFLDPQMVGWGFWVWAEPAGYFGIPWSNYVGWLLVASLMTLLVAPRPVPAWPFLMIYGIVWFLQTIGQGIFWGQVGPALVGFIVMGGLLGLALWRIRTRRS